jgi:hypothetical protein
MNSLSLLNARHYEIRKFVTSYKWVIVVNWTDEDISLGEILQVHAQAWEEGESTESAMRFAFPDLDQDLEVSASDYEDFDLDYYREARFECYYMGELFEQS